MLFAGFNRPRCCARIVYAIGDSLVSSKTAPIGQYSICFLRLNRCNVTRSLSHLAAQSQLYNLRERSERNTTLVLQSTSNDPYHNLAIEHYILTNSDPKSRILLFYTNRPCVVVGRNQNVWVECNLKLLQEGLDGDAIDLIRRRSGGGTVFHDEGNLNFSVIVPNDNDFTRKKHSEMVVRALNSVQKAQVEFDGPEHIWVNSRHDITMSVMRGQIRKEFKVSGSAYKLTRGRALHHGTLLHSSPNLDNISRFLRSPGKAYIEAKGVESVRSPVANIFKVSSSEERDLVRAEITNAIIAQFLKLYKSDAAVQLVGDADCQEDVNPHIAKGVDELRTDAWKFEQTPRFDYKSEVIKDLQLSFAVKNALLEEVRFGRQEVPLQDRPSIKIKQQRIHHIRHWSQVLEPNSVSAEHIAAVERVFPDLKHIIQESHSEHVSAQQNVQQVRGTVQRQSQDGLVEEESLGTNAVEEIRR